MRVTLATLAGRLGAGISEPMLQGAVDGAEMIAAGVRDRLSAKPGGDHAAPWMQSGALRESVGVLATDTGAVVGAGGVAAVAQELGTVHVPARPYLAPVAAELGRAVAEVVGEAAVAGLRAG